MVGNGYSSLDMVLLPVSSVGGGSGGSSGRSFVVGTSRGSFLVGSGALLNMGLVLGEKLMSISVV